MHCIPHRSKNFTFTLVRFPVKVNTFWVYVALLLYFSLDLYHKENSEGHKDVNRSPRNDNIYINT
jgi:hypothetical protein